MLVVTTFTFVVRHVFNYSHCWYFQGVEHFYTFDHINISQLLRCGNYHCRFDLHFLRKCELNISCAWWEVNYKIVEVLPLGGTDEL